MNTFQAMTKRRSIYALGDKLPISKDRVEEIVANAVKYTPSAFDSRSARLVLLFGDKHKKLWEITLDELRKVTPADRFPATEVKVNNCFAAGAGTVLFFEDRSVTEGLMNAFPTYADNFPIWSQHTSAMHQYAIWTALAEENVGASLQHYNPLIDANVAKAFDIPENWMLIAQMPFGNILADPDKKKIPPVADQLRVLGK